jgi:hypothetical protein
MSDSTVTVSDSNGHLDLTGNITDDTITFSPGTTTVTITQGPGITLHSPLTLPTTFSNGRIQMSSPSVPLNDGAFTFTCTNTLTSGASPAIGSFTLTVTIGNVEASTFKDPTMVFNPPE